MIVVVVVAEIVVIHIIEEDPIHDLLVEVTHALPAAHIAILDLDLLVDLDLHVLIHDLAIEVLLDTAQL